MARGASLCAPGRLVVVPRGPTNILAPAPTFQVDPTKRYGTINRAGFIPCISNDIQHAYVGALLYIRISIYTMCL